VVIAPAQGLPRSAPIIVTLSGLGASVAEEASRDQMIPYATAGEAELVYPVAVQTSWNAIGCCGYASAHNVNDLAFIEALVPTVDPGKQRSIYILGFSNGARLAYRIACTDPGLFAQIAVVKAMPEPGCVVSRPVTILQIDSMNDTAVPYQPGDKGRESPPATVQVARLQVTDGCPVAGRVQARGTMQLTTWTGCAHGTRLGFAVYTGGKHSFPQPAGTTPSGATVIWAFFTDSALP
jgi:polyhydroxybutyrate depolymerase